MVYGDHPREDEFTYEATLPALGALLDELQGSRVRVTRLADGFELSYDRDPSQAEPTSRILGHDELASRVRGPHARERRVSPPDAEPRLTYENLFRSLGRELQEASGQLLVLEELDDSVVLSYQHHGRASGSDPYSRQVVLNRADTWSLLAHGVERRNERLLHTVPTRARHDTAP